MGGETTRVENRGETTRGKRLGGETSCYNPTQPHPAPPHPTTLPPPYHTPSNHHLLPCPTITCPTLPTHPTTHPFYPTLPTPRTPPRPTPLPYPHPTIPPQPTPSRLPHPDPMTAHSWSGWYTNWVIEVVGCVYLMHTYFSFTKKNMEQHVHMGLHSTLIHFEEWVISTLEKSLMINISL